MIIKALKIELETATKIFSKHNVLQEEIHDVLSNDKPIYRKVGGNQYLAIGMSRSRYLTIFFYYDEKTKEAEITTAYPSDKDQIRFYKKHGDKK
ncbi:hypothetical protein JXA85_07455 [Candidatus Woesearchaeota archaeon]|nr:hypothetical protein [Candidatus Woesearchaeota archaeon]